MKDFTDLLLQIIINDIFIGFGFYSILYVLIAIVTKHVEPLEFLDRSSIRFIIFTGIVYLLATVVWIVTSVEDTSAIIGRGQFWWLPWMQPLPWIALTQLFWIKR